jgi:multicomponent Na+:H+ antiporter subunit G
MITCSLPIQEIIAALLMGLGLIFLVGSMIGMLRLPDFYSRVHASGNSETLGTMLVFLGLAVYNGVSITSANLLIILMFIFVGNPIGSHILTKAAYKTGHPVWTKKTLPADMLTDANIEGGEADANLHH